MGKQTAGNNDYLKEAKATYNEGYYKKAVQLVNEKGEEFAKYALGTWLVDYPELSGTSLTGLDLVEVLIKNGVTLEEANGIRLKHVDGMDDLIAYAKKLA